MGLFGEFLFGADVFGGTGGGVTPPPTSPSSNRWLLVNYSGGELSTFEINPEAASMPSFKRTLSVQSTVAGGQVLYEGREEPQKISFSGTLLTETQYNMLDVWSRVKKQVKIVDDLGQGFWVFIESFSPTRERNSQYPWMMTYRIECTILDWG